MKKKTKKVIKGWAVMCRLGFCVAYPKSQKVHAEVQAEEISEAGNDGKIVPCEIKIL